MLGWGLGCVCTRAGVCVRRVGVRGPHVGVDWSGHQLLMRPVCTCCLFSAPADAPCPGFMHLLMYPALGSLPLPGGMGQPQQRW